jgi:predicted dehydrogenase
MSKKINVAVIGAGIMGKLHARVISESDRENLVAIVDIDKNKAEELARSYNVEPFDDYSMMLNKTKVDAVCVATPDSMHFEPVRACLYAGKHVLVEKPLATDLKDSLSILNSAKKNNKVLMINYTHRWIPSYAKAKEIINNGGLGSPIMVYARKNDTIMVPIDMIKWSEETSPAKFLSTHDIDLALWFFNTTVKEVFAYGVKGFLEKKGIDVFDAIQALVKFKNGAIGTFESAWVYPNSFPNATDSYIQLVGESGVITLDRKKETLEAALQDGFSYVNTSIIQEMNNSLRGAFFYAHEHFIDCIINGRQPITSAEIGHTVTEISFAIHKSIEIGKPVKLPMSING